ncbi:MAG: hypothetical protein AAB295_05750 [Chloroflexota bacterium]
MNRIGRKVAIGALTAIIGTGLLGTAALAAFAPAPPVPTLPGTTAQAPKHDRLKAILDALVARGVITQQQAEAILAALKEERRDDGDFAKRVFANLFEKSAAYLEMEPAALRAKLPGTSLAAIADATPGKSADGLVRYLTDAVNAAIARALAEGKITQEQADRLTAAAPEHITRFVQHTWPEHKQRNPRADHPNAMAFIGDAVGAAREYLGLSREELMTALRSGKSLGQIADTTAGKSRDGLVAAITSATNARIDAAQASGKLTAEQATAARAKVQEAVAKAVDRTWPIKSR